MCEPTTLAIIGTATAVLGAGVSAYGAVQQGEAQQKAANYQAQVAKNNAIVAQQNATAVQNQATQKAIDTARAGEQRLGAQRAALAANGVTLDSVSALNVQDATVQNTALGEDRDRYQGQLAAYGYETQGTNYTAQAGLDTLQGQNASTAGAIGAGTSLLSGASQVSSKWAMYQGGGGGPGMSIQSGGLY